MKKTHESNKIVILVNRFILFNFLISTFPFLAFAQQNFEPVKPTTEQLAFQNMELGAFFHYSIDAYAEKGSLPGQTPASKFNPTNINVEQWVKAAKSMGATFAVLTARHEQGFCLWPTKTTDYSIKNSPYKNGKGDIVREFVNACRKYGLKPGLYTAPWIDSHWEAQQAGYKGGDSGDINKFNNSELFKKVWKKEKEQITELLTNYGPLVFIWDDHFGRSDALYDKPKGGALRKLYKDFAIQAHHLQPQCLLLGRDVEHVGNEDGRASYPLWNSLNSIDGTIYTVSKTYKWGQSNTGNPYGKIYRPQIACSTVAFTTGGWMWSEKRKPQPLERIMDSYYKTVGRGSLFIVNFAPDRQGLIEKNVVEAAKAFGDEIKRRFGHSIISSNSKEVFQTLKFKVPVEINHVILMEDLTKGQRISSYTIEAKENGQWKTIVKGLTIGHKRIDDFQIVKAEALRFKVNKVTKEPAIMRNISVYCVN